MPRKKKIAVPEPRQLPSGNWFIQLRIGGESISITEPDAATCHAKAVAIKAGLIEQRKKPEKITLSAAIDRYIEARSAVLSPSTIRAYNVMSRTVFADLQNTPVGEIGSAKLQRIVNTKKATHSAKYLKNAMALVIPAIREITGERLKVTLPQITSEPRPWLTHKQIPVFLSAIRGTSHEMPCLLALCGLRWSEIAGLRWQDVDLKKRIVRVRHTRVRNANNELVAKNETKNESSRRTVTIPSRLVDLLKAAPHTNEEYVVTTNDRTLRYFIEDICAANNLPNVGIHGLRHSFASLGHHLGVPERDMMELGGWADRGTMSKIYTHIAQADLDRHSNKMTSFIDKQMK